MTQITLADWHGNLRFRSDYVFRGYSKSSGNPVAQADINYLDSSGIFAGLALSQVKFQKSSSQAADLEIKPSLGWSLPLTQEWAANVAVNGYLYNNKIFARNSDYAELNATLSYQNAFSASVYLAPNAYQRQVNLLSYEVGYRRDILDNLQLSAGLGYSQTSALLGQDYVYWNAGVAWFLTSYLALDLRYVDAQLRQSYNSKAYAKQFYPYPLENNYLVTITLGF